MLNEKTRMFQMLRFGISAAVLSAFLLKQVDVL